MSSQNLLQPYRRRTKSELEILEVSTEDSNSNFLLNSSIRTNGNDMSYILYENLLGEITDKY